jgi:antitoxin component YwqK of YwqJK toxin-antitoxin module
MSGVEKKGEFRAWHPNGKLAHQSLWKDGKLNGVALFWWPNGQLKTRSFYKNGKNMSIKYWDERGNLIK